MRNNLILPLLLVLCLFLLLAGCGQTTDITASSDDNGQTMAEPEEPPDQDTSESTVSNSNTLDDPHLYSLEKYSQIQPGQSYEEVQTILGSPGENMVDNERLKSFQWTNKDGSMISVNFYDNEMMGKGQAHLGPLLEGGQRVTQGQFDQLKEGMTLEEVTAILGSGTERVFTVFDDEVEQIIGWENSDGSEISVTLLNNQVTHLSDLMLK